MRERLSHYLYCISSKIDLFIISIYAIDVYPMLNMTPFHLKSKIYYLSSISQSPLFQFCRFYNVFHNFIPDWDPMCRVVKDVE